jgi:hypothetical protein
VGAGAVEPADDVVVVAAGLWWLDEQEATRTIAVKTSATLLGARWILMMSAND